jgi:hypothetical protein
MHAVSYLAQFDASWFDQRRRTFVVARSSQIASFWSVQNRLNDVDSWLCASIRAQIGGSFYVDLGAGGLQTPVGANWNGEWYRGKLLKLQTDCRDWREEIRHAGKQLIFAVRRNRIVGNAKAAETDRLHWFRVGASFRVPYGWFFAD